MTTNTILVEARKDQNVKPILDAIAHTCSENGYRVKRWRGPLSGRVPFPRRVPTCDLAIVFNGTHKSYVPTLARLRQSNTPLLYVELGWYPQRGTFQIDHYGINSAASWVGEPLNEAPGKMLEIKSAGDLLVILQDDSDTQITHRSPSFVGMREFVAHICAFSELPIRVRFHPRHRPAAEVMSLIDKYRCVVDSAPTLGDALNSCRAVACINSSSGVEALARHIPVMCYGEAIYRHHGAVYCLTKNGESTRATTRQLANGNCSLRENLMNEVFNRIKQNQPAIVDIPALLPDLVDAALRRSKRSIPRAINFNFKSKLQNQLLRFRRAG